MSVRIFYSADRESGNASSYRLRLNKPIHFKKIALQNICVPMSMYNFVGKSIRTSEDNVTYSTATIPDGQYSAADLVALLSAKSVGGSGGLSTWSLSFDDVTGTFTITNNNGSGNNILYIDRTHADFPADLLGFDVSVAPTTVAQTGEYYHRLASPTRLSIVLKYYTETSIIAGTDGRYYTFCVVVDANFGETLFQQYDDFAMLYDTGTEVKTETFFNVELRDFDTGELIDLNNCEWSMKLMFY